LVIKPNEVSNEKTEGFQYVGKDRSGFKAFEHFVISVCYCFGVKRFLFTKTSITVLMKACNYKPPTVDVNANKEDVDNDEQWTTK
jgi:hypothetical protein